MERLEPSPSFFQMDWTFDFHEPSDEEDDCSVDCVLTSLGVSIVVGFVSDGCFKPRFDCDAEQK